MDTTWLISSEQWFEHIVVAAAAILVTALVVVIHYEGLHWLARRYSGRAPDRDRGGMLRIMFALLVLHIVEIWCYGIAYWLLLMMPGTGSVHGEHGIDNLFDAIYLSATIYTTLGLGDLAPVGAIRMLSGLESLTGFLLITWSASFTYLEMSRYWRRDD
jgi:Ion channel